MAIRYNGRNLVVEGSDARRLDEAGVEFAYLVNHETDGQWRIMTIPVND